MKIKRYTTISKKREINVRLDTIITAEEFGGSSTKTPSGGVVIRCNSIPRTLMQDEKRLPLDTQGKLCKYFIKQKSKIFGFDLPLTKCPSRKRTQTKRKITTDEQPDRLNEGKYTSFAKRNLSNLENLSNS